jgi:phosphoglycolate phosphatase-like HAD superfamily hydrolase
MPRVEVIARGHRVVVTVGSVIDCVVKEHRAGIIRPHRGAPVSADRPVDVPVDRQLALSAVLWDIDGTLVSSGGVSARAFLDAVAHVTGRRPEGRGLDLGGRIDPEIAEILLGSVDADTQLVPVVLDRLRDSAGSWADELRENVLALPGVVDVLTRLESAGVRQTVVTGNIESVALLKLDAANLVPPIDPTLGGYGDSGTTRVEVARHALDRLALAGWQLDLDRCWIVGDTPRDLRCARALGIRCALVASGRQSMSSMADLGADLLLPTLADTDELFERWRVVDA